MVRRSRACGGLLVFYWFVPPFFQHSLAVHSQQMFTQEGMGFCAVNSQHIVTQEGKELCVLPIEADFTDSPCAFPVSGNLDHLDEGV